LQAGSSTKNWHELEDFVGTAASMGSAVLGKSKGKRKVSNVKPGAGSGSGSGAAGAGAGSTTAAAAGGAGFQSQYQMQWQTLSSLP